MPTHLPTSTRPTAAILAVGDELVLGEKLDTNSMWMADRLGALGLIVAQHRTVGDDTDAIAGHIDQLARTHDVLIVGGGLGPTADDLTRHALAQAMQHLTGRAHALVEDALALEAIERYYHATGRAMPEANRVQALRPEGALALPNGHGTAPGMLAGLDVEGRPRLIACLPGPPREMRPMFEAALAPRLAALPGVMAAPLRVVQVFGLGESDLAGRIADLMHRGNNPAVGTTASSGLVVCRVRPEPGRPVHGPYRSSNPEVAVEEALAKIERRAEGYVVGRSPASLPHTVLDEAARHGLTLATAESCTGGLVGQMLTAEAGASRSYLGGWVAYNNAMKARELGVDAGLIDEHGAVSGPVARAMARGAAERASADIGLSITGIAGPDGGTSEKPVGTVWIGCHRRGGLGEARCFRYAGDRQSIRAWSAQTALFLGLSAIRGRVVPRLLRELSTDVDGP